ncbi:LbtU family siderophore porin [Legionella israelensis]|uniref:LbtU family siderophore porin n=1 Tax=Legionella israelensis TaxID=454 RepID=A0AAX1EDM5_9GAMM|nr:LbtU family siderophore porin [Legionella israelensis]QBR82962.1 LbtU family siderophore porin [Legionella israelensis]
MRLNRILLFLALSSAPLYATDQQQLQDEIQQLKQQTQTLQAQLKQLQKKISENTVKSVATKPSIKKAKGGSGGYHESVVSVHSFDGHPESLNFYPTALLVDEHVVTYIAGTPVVSSPYLGERPAFDGSDYIVNISSINRDIRLMQQRRRLYRAYQRMGYPVPYMPIISLSGAVQPVAILNFEQHRETADLTLGTSELDVAAALNENVEAFMAITYDQSPPAVGGPRVNNSVFNLNMGFINIGNLDKTPYYFTAGQLFVPFGRYSSAMASSPLTLLLARTKSRPFILGYKSQTDTGLFASVYGFRGETTLGKSGVGGVNAGYTFSHGDVAGEVGGGYINSINDSAGMQNTAVTPFTTFGGFGSVTNGSEAVRKIPGANVHGNISIDRYNFTAEWVGAAKRFRPQDLSFNGRGAKPQAAQFEAGMTFKVFDKPASIGIGYQLTRQALALNLPERRISGVFNISLWKDTIETLEYRHDINYKKTEFANGAAPAGTANLPVVGRGGSEDAILAQIGVYF